MKPGNLQAVVYAVVGFDANRVTSAGFRPWARPSSPVATLVGVATAWRKLLGPLRTLRLIGENKSNIAFSTGDGLGFVRD